jgi:hypothetical protein
MRSLGIVLDEDALHLLKGLERGSAALNAEMFVEKGAMPALDNAVGLRPVDPGPLVHDVFELQYGVAVDEVERIIGREGRSLRRLSPEASR